MWRSQGMKMTLLPGKLHKLPEKESIDLCAKAKWLIFSVSRCSPDVQHHQDGCTESSLTASTVDLTWQINSTITLTVTVINNCTRLTVKLSRLQSSVIRLKANSIWFNSVHYCCITRSWGHLWTVVCIVKGTREIITSYFFGISSKCAVT